jgi:hypothetical protein
VTAKTAVVVVVTAKTAAKTAVVVVTAKTAVVVVVTAKTAVVVVVVTAKTAATAVIDSCSEPICRNSSLDPASRILGLAFNFQLGNCLSLTSPILSRERDSKKNLQVL